MVSSAIASYRNKPISHRPIYIFFAKREKCCTGINTLEPKKNKYIYITAIQSMKLIQNLSGSCFQGFIPPSCATEADYQVQ